MPQIHEPRDEQLGGFHSAVLHDLPEAVIVTRNDGTITYVNGTAESLLGYAASELMGEPLGRLVPPDPARRADPVKWLGRWAAAPDVEQSRFLELTARRRDGIDLTVEVRVREGRIEGEQRFLITVRDNTARRLEQIALKDANLRAARLLMVAADAIITIDADHNIVFFNPAAEQMFGYPADDVIGRPLGMLIPAGHRGGHDAHVAAFRQSKAASRLMSERAEVVGQRRDGSVFPVEATITRVSAGGVLTFTAQLRDVTQRNQARAELLERERRIRAVFDHTAEAIALLDAAGIVLEANLEAHALTTEGKAAVGQPIWNTAWLGGERPPGPGSALETAVRRAAVGEAGAFGVEVDQGKGARRLSVRVTPIPGSQGGVRYILVEARSDAAG